MQPIKTPTKPDRPVDGEAAEGTILIIDDDASILRVGARTLGRIGFAVLCAKRGARGIELCREHAGELEAVMVDLSMPDMDGAQVVRAIRQFDREVPVFICSGHDAEEAKRRVGDAAVDAFIQKPYSRATLLAHLRPA